MPEQARGKKGQRYSPHPPHLPLPFLALQVVLAVVSIVSLIAHDSWGFVWLVTGAASLVVMGLPQVVDILYRWKARKHVPLKEVN